MSDQLHSDFDQNKPSPAPGAGGPGSLDSTEDQVDREVREAMAAMDAADIAELRGEPASSRSVSTPRDGETIPPGSELVGTVVGFSDDEVFLEFDAKLQGAMPRSQFGKKEVLEIGRRVDAVADRYDASSGLLIVTRKGSPQRATWTNLTVGMIVEGKVTGVNKGGLEVDLRGVRAFLPGSQVDVFPMKDISLLLGANVRAEVIELDRRHKNILISRRRVLERERSEQAETLRTELAVGQTRKGVVGNITDFGAFVDLGGIDGLIHIRDISWGQVDDVNSVLKPGQQVEVLVLKIDSAKGRISLGLKQNQPDPWETAAERYSTGIAAKARVLRLADFGAFAELEPGVEGLIPHSEMGWQRTNRPSESVSVGSIVDVVVIRIEPSRRRIALSMKQALPDPWAGVLESFTPQSMIRGKVVRLVDFGAFVEVASGVEGLIHISELSDRHVKTCREVVSVGQEVDVRVLGVDQENRRISLSLKPAAAQSKESDVANVSSSPSTSATKAAKKRKKPLRGGLAGNWDW